MSLISDHVPQFSSIEFQGMPSCMEETYWHLRRVPTHERFNFEFLCLRSTIIVLGLLGSPDSDPEVELQNDDFLRMMAGLTLECWRLSRRSGLQNTWRRLESRLRRLLRLSGHFALHDQRHVLDERELHRRPTTTSWH